MRIFLGPGSARSQVLSRISAGRSEKRVKLMLVGGDGMSGILWLIPQSVSVVSTWCVEYGRETYHAMLIPFLFDDITTLSRLCKSRFG